MMLERNQGLKANMVALQTQIDGLETQLAETESRRQHSIWARSQHAEVDDMKHTIAGIKDLCV
jgi:hypothetical protein